MGKVTVKNPSGTSNNTDKAVFDLCCGDRMERGCSLDGAGAVCSILARFEPHTTDACPCVVKEVATPTPKAIISTWVEVNVLIVVVLMVELRMLLVEVAV
jgi:hypothetical protein